MESRDEREHWRKVRGKVEGEGPKVKTFDLDEWSSGEDVPDRGGSYRFDDNDQFERQPEQEDQRRARHGDHDGRTPSRSGNGDAQHHEPADRRLETEVLRRLAAHSDLDERRLVVDVRDGEVHLKGAVGSRQEKRLAEEIAAAVAGARGVRNGVRIEMRSVTSNFSGLQH